MASIETITDKKLLEVIGYISLNGEEKAVEHFGYKQDTLRRYLAEARKRFGESEVTTSSALQRIAETYSDKELLAIANGGRIMPGIDKVPVIDFEGERIRIGVLSDTHLGSLYSSPDMLFQAFEEFKKEGVDFITHSGDVTEGMSNRAGHMYELSHLGYHKQRKLAVDVFGQWTDTPIYMIDGNHDRWFIKANDARIVYDICESLPNCEFLGHDEGDISLKGKAILKLWHGEDGNCFDDKTEILTQNGFIPFRELSKKMKVATMSKDSHTFEWQKPQEITEQTYSGEMYHFKSRIIDCLVTPNHGMWTRANKSITKIKDNLGYPTKSHIKTNYNWHRKNAKDIFSDWKKQKWQFTTKVEGYKHTKDYSFITIPFRESKNPGVKVKHFDKIDIENIAELIAWYVTEGYANPDNGSICICQDKKVNEKNHNAILNLLNRIGINNYRCGGKNYKDIVFGSMEMTEFLHKECGHLSKNKFLPKWLKEQPLNIINIVFETMIKGDGWINGRGFGYKSISQRLLDDFAEIAIKLGYGVTFHKDTVHIRKIQNYPALVSKPQMTRYSGKIYCCSVPNGLICVRRNGKVLWTHNSYALSYRLQKVIESLTGGEKPGAIFAGHTHKSVYIFERHIHCYSAGAIQRQTKWMRGKRIASHTGFWIIDIYVGNKGITKTTGTWFPFYC